MNLHQPYRPAMYARATALVSLIVVLATVSVRLRADTGMCSGASITIPFTDVPASNIFFCSVNVTNGFVNPVGILYDGPHIWVTDEGDDTLKKINSSGLLRWCV